jgi:cyclic-di-GMP-binding protein
VAKDQFSFDIVSEVDLQEVRNAVDQASREISQRFDFKGTGTSVSLESDKIEVAAGTEDRLKAAWQVLQEKAVKRQVPLKSLKPGEVQPATKGTVRQSIEVIQGIPDEKAKQISKFVRSNVPKAQTHIQGSQLRVSAKSKDDLQSAIRAVKEEDFGLALQFTNYR